VGARLAKGFYHGEFLGAAVTTKMIEFGSQSGKILEMVQDLLEGSQSYLRLIMRLHVVLARALLESGAGRLRAMFDPGAGLAQRAARESRP